MVRRSSPSLSPVLKMMVSGVCFWAPVTSILVMIAESWARRGIAPRAAATAKGVRPRAQRCRRGRTGIWLCEGSGNLIHNPLHKVEHSIP